jgi:hypothetical protein
LFATLVFKGACSLSVHPCVYFCWLASNVHF